MFPEEGLEAEWEKRADFSKSRKKKRN